MYRNALQPLAVIVVWWWFVLSAIAVLHPEINWVEAVRSSVYVLLMVFWGMLSGLLLVVAYSVSDYYRRLNLIKGGAQNGLHSSLGEIPMPTGKIPETLKDIIPVNIPHVPDDFLPDWYTKYAHAYPHHAGLMRRLVRVFQWHQSLPATHVPGGHGGNSLLQHSILTGFLMQELANDWKYTGLKDRTGKREILKLRDPEYRFVVEDPLVAIIGLAHDIGKIEAYRYDAQKKVIGIGPEHDLTGSRMLARLPEVWLIPPEDRQALLLSVAHYHHPHMLPLAPDRRALDDRTIALMELLIKTDFVASAVESGDRQKNAQEKHDQDRLDVNDLDLSDDEIYQALLSILSETERINGSDPRYNVGCVCIGDLFQCPMLILKEDMIRGALISNLKIEMPDSLGDRRNLFTIRLLRILADKGVLYCAHAGMEYSPENALWNIDFMKKSANGTALQKSTGWSAAIVLYPEKLGRVAHLEPYWWYAVIVRGTFGAARAKKQTLSDMDEENAQLAIEASRQAIGANKQKPRLAIMDKYPQRPKIKSTINASDALLLLQQAVQDKQLMPVTQDGIALFTPEQISELLPSMDWQQFTDEELKAHKAKWVTSEQGVRLLAYRLLRED